MFAKLFSNKTLCLTSPELDLALDYDKPNEDEFAVSLGMNPKQFQGDIFTLFDLLGGQGTGAEAQALMGDGLSDLMTFLNFKPGQICIGGLVSFGYDQIRLIYESDRSATGSDNKLGKRNFCLEVQGQLALTVDLARWLGSEQDAAKITVSGRLRVNVGNMGFSPVSFVPDEDSTQLPSQLTVPLFGAAEDLVLTPDIKGLSVIPEGKSVAIECFGELAISGGPELIQKADGEPHVLPLALSLKKGVMRLGSELFIPAMDIDLSSLLGIDRELGNFGLDVGNFTISLPTDGSTPASCRADLHWRLPNTLNSLLPGLEPFNVYDPQNPEPTTFKTRLVIDKNGPQAQLLSSPFKPLTAGEMSLTSDTRLNDKGEERLWWSLNMAQFGHIEMMTPIFSFDSKTGACHGEGGVKIIKPLTLPLSNLSQILTKNGMGFLAPLLPDDLALPMQKNGESHELSLSDLGILGQLLSKAGLNWNKIKGLLPDRLEHYLTVSFPDEFSYHFNLDSKGSCTGGIQLPEGQYLKLLIPAGPALYGIELRQLSLGQYNGGKLGVLQVDGCIDLFMLPEIVASMAATALNVPMLPKSNTLVMSLEMSELLALVHFQSGAVIPVFYDNLELNRIGFEGVKLCSQWQLPKPVPDVLGLSAVIGDLIDFVTDADALLDANTDPFKPPLAFTIGKNYLQLPEYLGGALLGQDSQIAQVKLWSLIAHALNFTKTGRLDELLLAVPQKYRGNDITMSFFDLAGLDMAWLISSNQELPSLLEKNDTGLEQDTLTAMQEFLPSLPVTQDNQLIAMLHGGFELPGFKVTNTIGMTQSDSSIGVGFALASELAYLMHLNVKGAIGVVTEPKANLQLLGSCELSMVGQSLLSGEVSLVDDVFTIRGALGLDIPAVGLAVGGAVTGAFSSKGVTIEGNSRVQLAGINLQQGSVNISEKGFMTTASLHGRGGTPAFTLKHCSLAMVSGRGVKAPKLKDLSSFPLLKETASQSKLLNDLAPYLPEDKNQFSLAGGLKFNSYHLIDSEAALMMSLGPKPSVHLVGRSTMQLPAKTSKPVIKMAMDYQAKFDPADGVFKLDGGLNNNSYVLSKKAKLSGRFAYYNWLSGRHAGDFVVSMGGYHPKFERPSHYPDVPRLGLNWKLTSKIRVKGSLYSALTPVAIMAGGKLEAQYKKGNLKAWFGANADFLMYWQPFYYQADIGVRVGASYKVSLGFLGSKTFKTSMGADLELWGPDFAGKAKIKWSVIRFTIRFGSSKSLDTSSISWNTFEANYLASAKDSKFEHFSLLQGETGTLTERGETWHIVDPDKVELQLNSPTPLHKLSLKKTDNTGAVTVSGNSFHLAPVNAESTKNWDMSIDYSGPSGIYFVAEAQHQNYAAAVWGNQAKPKLNTTKRTLKLLNSARVLPAPGKPPGFTEAVDADEFKYQDIIENDPYWQWGEADDGVWSEDDKTNSKTILDTLETSATEVRREQIAELFDVTGELNVGAITADIHSAFIGIPQTKAA